ncbi:hypothetical protein KVR01_004148 [Diaporthe batatas]|uniref:uncharacterized protein n=1 Tax=Diaporthe batatas TaxID=748121 RepID=UPI001D05A5F8|nr:uncharacterized protein KVR01_004148 [Diaporthe batatas]KAG8165596.1 hypothetical protein KVR01_004148 [Diaporthe batatas]
MEALAAVSLAGNILQFVETIKKLVSSAHQVYHIGISEDHLEIDSLTDHLQAWVSRVTPPDPPSGVLLSEDEKSIRALGAQCNQVAQQLLGVVNNLKVTNRDGTHGRIESFYKALLGVWKQGEVEALQARLERIGDNIQKHLAAYDSKKILQRLDDLEKGNYRLEAHRAEEISELRTQFSDIFTSIGDNLGEANSRARTSTILLGAAAKGSRYSVEQAILEDLRFDAINDRHDTIRDAHEQTLTWLFGTDDQCSPSTFDAWLTSDDDLYWISGKPGSGKSTLMKFLCDHPRTIEKLEIWSKKTRLIRAEYFFWGAGRQNLQKSQEGLLRSIVYQILRQCPDLIPQTYPNTWRLCFPEDQHPTRAVSTTESASALVPLSVLGLLATIRTVCDLAAQSEAKFCFFIDGLDEYDGKPADVIDLIRALRTLPNVKLCLSSRDWNEFDQEFGKDRTQRLYMQDFNRNDISAYVHDTFAKDDNYQEMEDRDTAGKELIEEIVEAANGVFLWVFLVVRSFQEGLTNADDISDLQQRLRTLPKDLNEYFERILLFDVVEDYRRQSAEIFCVTVSATEDLPLIAYWFIGKTTDYALNLEPNPITPQLLNKRRKDVKKQLNARCKGLLEAVFSRIRHARGYLQSFVGSNKNFSRGV